MAELLYWIVLDFTGVSNKVATEKEDSNSEYKLYYIKTQVWWGNTGRW